MWKPSAPDQPLALAPRRIGSILRGAGPSGALAAQARILVRVERTVHRILGESSVPHVRAGRLSPSSLVLTVDSPAWASITRFRAPDIRAAVLPEAPRLRQVRIVVREPEPAADSGAGSGPAAAPPSLSPFAARVLRSVARSTDNPRLARVLMRLATRERPPAGAGPASGSSPSGISRPRRDGRR